MKSSAKKIELASVDDLFSTEEGRQDAKLEKIQEIPLTELHPFKNHPFKVKDDEAMMETADSIKQYGVLVPAIARPDPEGGYELVAGHRRHRASELAEKETMPVIVRDLDDDAATIIMVDSNLQRESLLPSERAFAYKMKLDAMKHQGERVDLTSSQVGTKLRADEKVAKDSGESRNQVQRFVRLTNLVPELLDMVDEKKISFNPAVELSYLDEKQQQDFLEAMDASQNAPSLSQAIRIKKLAQQGEFDYDAVYNIMNEEKKSELDTVTIKNETLRKYFPRNYTPRQMESIIIKLLDQWQLKKQQAKQKKQENVLMTITMIFSVVISVGLFMVLPYLIASLLRKVGAGESAVTVAEAFIRIALFLAYLVLISKMQDIQRVFMYHGAEHKCINCVESGKALTVENVMKSSRFHKRCGTSFLFFVIIISIIFFIGFFAIVPVKTMWMRVVIRVLLVPVVAGVSYEFIRLAGNSENKVVALLSKPGLCMQKLTTKEPTPDMAEVAIMAVEAVFDWKAYLRENFENAEGEIKKAEEAEHTAGEANDNL